MSGSHRSLLARHIGPLLVFGELSILKYVLFFPEQLHAALILAQISFEMSEVCNLSEVFEFWHYFKLFLIF